MGSPPEPNHEWLRSHGVTPVSYGDGLKERILALAPNGVDAFIDLFGPDYVRLAVDLGVPHDRIETIIAFDAAKEYGTQAAGSGDASTTEVLAEVAALVAFRGSKCRSPPPIPSKGSRMPTRSSRSGHTRGKIVLIP